MLLCVTNKIVSPYDSTNTIYYSFQSLIDHTERKEEEIMKFCFEKFWFLKIVKFTHKNKILSHHGNCLISHV